MKQEINTLTDLKKFVFDFAKNLKANDVICLDGDLGAGKTQFTKFLGEFFHVKEKITSPTFPIVLEHNGDLPLYHFDFYRLEKAADLYEIGYYDYLELDGISVIEWSNRFADEIPEGAYRFVLEKSHDKRKIEQL